MVDVRSACNNDVKLVETRTERFELTINEEG